MTEAAQPMATRSAAPASPSTPAQSRSPIVLSEAWKQLHLSSPSHSFATPSQNASTSSVQHSQSTQDNDDADSSDDGFLSDHSDEIHPETGFDPFLAATKRARQHSSSSLLSPQPPSSAAEPSASSSSSATSSDSVATTGPAPSQQEDAQRQEAYRWSRIAKYWSKVVDEAMLQPKHAKQGTIDLSDKNITDILPTVADLSRYVALAPPRYDQDDESQSRDAAEPQNLLQSKTGGLVRHESYLAPFSAHIHNDSVSSKRAVSSSNRTLSRSQSAFMPAMSRAQSFARSNSAMSGLSSKSAGSYRDHRDRQATLSIFLGSNALTRLPSALFQLQNLRVLSLRANKLKVLPPAIGDLHNLSELHVPNNELQYLPAEILRLKLDVFTWFPNPYLLKPPKTGVLTVRPVLCHGARRIRQQHKLAELDDIDEADDASTTPVRTEFDNDGDEIASVPVSQQPPPIIRAPATGSARQQRLLDRTRSDMQVESFLARGIDRLGGLGFASISEQGPSTEDDSFGDNSTDAADSTMEADDTAVQPSVLSAAVEDDGVNATEAVDEEERERQRILEAAFEEDDAFDLTPSTEQAATTRGKVTGRSRVLGSKQTLGVPSLLELCIRKLLSPYDVASAEAQGISSPFLSPVVHTAGGSQRRRSSSRNNSRTNTPLFEAQLRNRSASFGSRTRSFSSNGGPEDSKFGKRVPTLLEAYENGTLQSLGGELSHGLVSKLEAARRSATQDWGTRARMRSTSSATTKKNSFARTQSVVDAFPTAGTCADDGAAHTQREQVIQDEGGESYDVFGGVDVAGSLDRGDDACANPWFSRCPNPKHCDERLDDSHGVKRRDIALHRGKRGFGSTSSVSSLGTTLGAGKTDPSSLDMERAPSTAASSDSGAAPASPVSSSASSVGTVAFGSVSTTSVPSRPESQLGGQQVRFAPNAQRSFTSCGLGRAWSSSRPFTADRGMARPPSTAFVRGFSTTSALSASGLHRSTSFADDATERDWPLSEAEHRQAPVFSTAGETRIEWISHIGGIRVAKLGEAMVELDSVAGTDTRAEGDATQQSLMGAMGGFENKDLLPILWRGCGRGCLDFLV